jgi:hypothetical protein
MRRLHYYWCWRCMRYHRGRGIHRGYTFLVLQILAVLLSGCASNSSRVGFGHQTWKPGRTIDPTTNTITKPDWSIVPGPSAQSRRLPGEDDAPLSALAEKVRKRDGANYLGVYMGMIAEWDGSTSVYQLHTNKDGTADYSRDGYMIPNKKPMGVMMFSATSGEWLKWISAEDFTNIFVLKTKPEYPR